MYVYELEATSGYIASYILSYVNMDKHVYFMRPGLKEKRKEKKQKEKEFEQRYPTEVEDAPLRCYRLSNKNLSARRGIPPSVLLVRDTPKCCK